MDWEDERQGGHPREGRSHHQNKAMAGCPNIWGSILYNLGANQGKGVSTII